MALRSYNLVLVLIFFVTKSLAFDPHEPQEYYRICPLHQCNRCPTADKLRAPGVGFALDTSHGTAAVRLHDGTFHHVALIEGDSSYTALMLQLATGPVDRTPDSLDTPWKKLGYARSRAQRLANKLIGRPATPETDILTAMVSKLLSAAQKRLGDEHAIHAAVLSSPDRVRLTDEEIGDVFDYLKLQNIMKNNKLSLYELYAESAAYVGYGKGLCQSYTDQYVCEREELSLPMHRVLHLDLSPETLSGTIKTLQKALSPSVDASFVDTSLGSAHAGDDIGNEQFWTTMSDRIRELARSVEKYVYLPQITQLILTGPSAANVRFQEAIRNALSGLVADETVLFSETIGDDQEQWQELFKFATARGAAEFAKRRQEGPTNCAQTDECKHRRERVHDEARVVLLEQKPEL